MTGPLFAGMRVVVTAAALAETTVRLFPASKNRSRRIHKKLVKRFGGEFRKEPAAFQVADPLRNGEVSLVIHPALYEQLKAATAEVTS